MAKIDIPKIPSSEITPEHVYINRRQFMRGVGLAAGALAVAACAAPGAKTVPTTAPSHGCFTRRRRCTGRANRGALGRRNDRRTGRPADHLRGGDHLQQLLRVRHRQERAGDPGQGFQGSAVERSGRWVGQQARHLRRRGLDAHVPAGGAHLSPALRGGLVDGHPVAGLSAQQLVEGGGADRRRQVRALQTLSTRSRCPVSGALSTSGPTSKGCASTKR